jgi:hypothetical protein
MREKKQLNHDITNHIERLRIMQNLASSQSFEEISPEELRRDLEETLNSLKKCFEELLQY